MDLYTLEFKDMGTRYLTRNLDKRYFSVVKLSVITFVLEFISAITIIAFNTNVFNEPPDASPWGIILLVLICVGIAQLFFTFLYAIDEGFEWNREYKSETVYWGFNVPIKKEHAWHPTYAKAMTDLFWQAKRAAASDKQIPKQWVHTFDALNQVMADLTQAREMQANPVPNVQDYVRQIELEKEFLKPTGKYSLSEVLGDFPD